MEIDEEKVRSGHTGDGVRYMLLGSLFLGIVALGVMVALAIG